MPLRDVGLQMQLGASPIDSAVISGIKKELMVKNLYMEGYEAGSYS